MNLHRKVHPLFNSSGFTLIEVLISVSILILVITAAFNTFLFVQKTEAKQMLQNQINDELFLSLMKLKSEIRLSQSAEIYFYPPQNAEHTALSFPVRQTENKVIEDDGTVKWDTLIAYHTKTEKGKTQLIRTVFSDWETMSHAARTAQLETLAKNGSIDGGDSRVLTENISTWRVSQSPSFYDGYNPVLGPDTEASLGLFKIGSGEQILRLTATNKNVASSGNKIGIDTLKFSPTGLHIEAEELISEESDVLFREQNLSGMLKSSCQLSYIPSGTGDFIEIPFYNDTWIDTLFNHSSSKGSNTTVGTLDVLYTPPEYTLKLIGNHTNLTAQSITKDQSASPDQDDCLVQHAINWSDFEGATVLSRIVDIAKPGAGCRLAFSASSEGALKIENAYIAEIDARIDTPSAISPWTQISFDTRIAEAGNTVWSELIDFTVTPGKEYAVKFTLPPNTTKFYPKLRTALEGNNCSWLQLKGSSDFIPLKCNVGVEMLFSSYPVAGTFISQVIDTHLDVPDFNFNWEGDLNGGDIRVGYRTSSRSDMSDLSFSRTGSSIGARYLQYQATLTSSSKGEQTPKLRFVQFKWPGEERVANLGGTFINGPEYGQFRAQVGNKQMPAPIRISIELEKQFMNESVLKSTQTIYVTPRNQVK